MMNNKKEEQKPLTNNDIEWLEKERMLFEKRKIDEKKKAVKRVQYSRFRKKMLKTIEILTKASKLLPEKQRMQVLTVENLRPLFIALLTFEREEKEKEKVVTNERVFEIVWMLKNTVERTGINLVGKPYSSLVYFRPDRSRIFESMEYIRLLSRAQKG
jgi:hypothetical protein